MVVTYLEERIKEMTICLNRKVMKQKSLVIAIYMLQKNDVVYGYESNGTNIIRSKR